VNPTQAGSEEIERYLQGVRTALADLPAEVRDELLEDLPAHLADVVAEADGEPLRLRLGAPETYAAELRAAAGIEPAVATPRWAGSRQALGRARQLARRANLGIGPLLGYPTVADFGRALRPGWWVLRGYAAGMLALGLAFSTFRLVPRIDTTLPITLAVLALAIGLSVRIGRLTLTERRRVLVALANIVAVLLLAGGAAKASRGPETVYEGGVTNYIDYNNQIVDIYPYDEHGNPLSGVVLIDQNGNVLHFGDPSRCANKLETPPEPRPDPIYRYPLCPLGPGTRLVPAPTGSPAPSTSPSPSPSASVAPSPS
jgi:hypothetical protein